MSASLRNVWFTPAASSWRMPPSRPRAFSRLTIKSAAWKAGKPFAINLGRFSIAGGCGPRGEHGSPWGRAIPGGLRAGEPGRPPRHNARRSRQFCYTLGTEPSAVFRVWGKGETGDFKCRLRDPRLARSVRWNSIGQERGALFRRVGFIAPNLIAFCRSKTGMKAVHAPPADGPCRKAGTVCVGVNLISADGTPGVSVAVSVRAYRLVADRACRSAGAVAIGADVLATDPACRVAVSISVRVHSAIAVYTYRITRSIRVKDGALGVQRRNGYR